MSQRVKKEGRFFGSGKIQELKNRVQDSQSDLVVFNGSLTPVQTRNLEKILQVPVMERNQLILKIFSDRAQSYEGRLQVELAQYLDELPRLRGAWLGSLSRQGGGVRARGPGEKAKETDRRQIQKKIRFLRKKLIHVRRTRLEQRKLRQKKPVCNFALIGYTNSGKSALLNCLSGSHVPAENHVFLTLDPITRRIFIPGLPQAVLTDTVGFIQDLPPHLISAFKATLEESAFADVLLHVIDLSHPHRQQQMEVVDSLVKELKWSHKPMIYVYNKKDKVSSAEMLFMRSNRFRCFVSALSREGIPRLLEEMKRAYFSVNKEMKLFFPKSDEHKIYTLSRTAHICKTECSQGGTLCLAQLSQQQISEWKSFILNEQLV